MSSILFKELNISDELKKAISVMGFEKATPVQEKTITPIIDGLDLVAQAPTGTGKTCAFGIPLIECTEPDSEFVSGLVLCPTRELCIQTTSELAKLSKFKKNIRVMPVYGGQDFRSQLTLLKRKPQIIVATPGRLMDHMRRHTISLDNLKFMVLDEADEMLNMGFREDIDTILKSVPDTRQTMLFSATISPDIMAITKKYQKDAVSVKVDRKEANTNAIEQYYIKVKDDRKQDTLTLLIDEKGYKTCMVFCNTKRMVDRLTRQLIADGRRADCIHGDMKQPQRDSVMGRFKKHSFDILVATDVAARGIDVDGIEAIFNYDLPTENEYYIHRIGRTGRADKSGVSYSFVQPGQMSRLNEIMKYSACTVIPYKMPSSSEAEAAKANKLFDKIKSMSEGEVHAYYVDLISKYLCENEDLTALDIAASLMNIVGGKPEKLKKQAQKSSASYSISDSIDTPYNACGDVVRIFMNIGSLDKINKRNMLDLFKLYTSIDVSSISKIDIFDKYSFVNIPADCAEAVIDSISGNSCKGRTIAVELAQDSNRKAPKKRRIQRGARH